VAFNSETYADVEKRISRDIDASEEPIGWLSMHDTIEEAKRRRAEHERRAA
jgi:hypothetical protein